MKINPRKYREHGTTIFVIMFMVTIVVIVGAIAIVVCKKTAEAPPHQPPISQDMKDFLEDPAGNGRSLHVPTDEPISNAVIVKSIHWWSEVEWPRPSSASGGTGGGEIQENASPQIMVILEPLEGGGYRQIPTLTTSEAWQKADLSAFQDANGDLRYDPSIVSQYVPIWSTTNLHDWVKYQDLAIVPGKKPAYRVIPSMEKSFFHVGPTPPR